MTDRTRPLVFIGSSAEGLDVAKAIQSNLDFYCESVIWYQGIFGLSGGTLESLVKTLDKYDFAILVLTPDDLVTERGESKPSPRDNVLLELGLFIGGLGIGRTFMVVDRQAKLKLPRDLAGITPATFQPPQSGTMQAALGTACTAIENEIKSLGIRGGRSVKVTAGYFRTYKGEEGIQFTITNTGKDEFPPYQLGIFHPRVGSYFIFPSKNTGPLLPDQIREHRCTVFVNRQLNRGFPRFDDHMDGNEWAHVPIENFRFRLVLEHSAKILYENAQIGMGFAKLIRGVLADGGFGGESPHDWTDLYA